MSDAEGAAAAEVAAATEAPEGVVATETLPAAPEGSQEEPQATARQQEVEQVAKTRAERVRAMRERLASRAQEQPRNADGTFAPKEGEGEGTEKQDAAAEGAAAEADSAAAVAAESGSPDGVRTVTIPLDPSNPLYEQGIKELPGVPAELERTLRTLLNNPVRRREVEQAQAAAEAAEAKLAAMQARMELLQSGELPNYEGNPELDALLKDVERAYPEQGELVKRAFQALQAQERGAREAEATAMAERKVAGTRFMSAVTTRAAEHYPIWAKHGELGPRMQRAVAQYGDYVDARNANLKAVGQPERMPSAQEFFGWVDTHYVKDPRVQEHLRKYQSEQTTKAQKEAAAKAAAEERRKMAEAEKQKLEEAAQRHSTRPPSPPPMRSHGASVDAGGEKTDPSQHHGTRQRDLRARVRQRIQQAGST